MTTIAELLPDDLLETFRGRARELDENNGFFAEDLADLKATGYLTMLVPEQFGGGGLSLGDAAAAQRRLAAAAPATALGVNMHHVIVGLARTLWQRGDDRARAILGEAVAGEVFAFGISEAGNDSVLFDAVTTAEPVARGFALRGRKIFTSLSPAWTRLLVHARRTDRDDDAPDALVFGVLERGDPGITSLDDWDALGMRASQSRTTELDGAVLTTERVLTEIPVGPSPDPVVWGIFGCFELLLAAVYTGIADRAIEVAAAMAGKRMSRARDASYATDPDIRWHIAEAVILRDGIELQLRQLCADVDSVGTKHEVEHGPRWFVLFSGVKHRATETSREVVQLALRASGGSQFRRGSELERLYRDVLAGMYHPSDNESVHAATVKAVLGPLGS